MHDSRIAKAFTEPIRRLFFGLAVALAAVALARDANGAELTPVGQPAATNAARPASRPNLDACLRWDATFKETTVSNGVSEAHFVFSVTNVSPADVVIRQVQTSCECTTTRLPPLPWRLAPGQCGQIHATMALDAGLTTMIRTLTVKTDKGDQLLFLRADVLPAPASASASMSPAERLRNQRIAAADRQAVFSGDCARCHAEPARGKTGQALYAAACGICHDARHRAAMVPELRSLMGRLHDSRIAHGDHEPGRDALPRVRADRQVGPTRFMERKDAEFWRNWITYGKPGSLMPAFAQSQGGILSADQIASLANYLATAK